MQIISIWWNICCHSMWIIQEVAKEMDVISYVIKNMCHNMPFKNLRVNVAVRGNYYKTQVLKQNVKRHVNYLPYVTHFLIAENILKTAVKPVEFLRTFSHFMNFRRRLNNFKSFFSCPHDKHYIGYWPVTITVSSPKYCMG